MIMNPDHYGRDPHCKDHLYHVQVEVDADQGPLQFVCSMRCDIRDYDQQEKHRGEKSSSF